MGDERSRVSLLTALGLASLAAVVAFTWVASRRPAGEGQTPRSAAVEAWCNIGVGFGFNYLGNLLILPLVHASFTLGENFWIGCCFTAISFVRQYALRRWFNARIVAAARRLG